MPKQNQKLLTHIFLPMESSVRELDAKILLACIASSRGMRAYLGSTTDINRGLWRLPRGHYVAKALTSGSVRAFKRARRFGHCVVAQDEEAIVHYPAELFYPRRMARKAVELVDRFLAWGPDNVEMWSNFPGFPSASIDLVGNPRGDLLRPELRALFDDEVRELRQRYGRFVLINTNFGSINCEVPELNLKYEDPANPGEYLYGVTSRGLPRQEADSLFAHRLELFRSFERMIPAVARALPKMRFIVRPHFAESVEHWEKLLSGLPNTVVERRGNVIPWLYAAGLMIHNGCTTAVEAYMLGAKAIAYEEVRHKRYDLRLPNELSRSCSTHEGLVEAIEQEMVSPQERRSEARAALLSKFVYQTDRLASEHFVDALSRVDGGSSSFAAAVARMLASSARMLPKRAAASPDARASHKLAKFPGLVPDQVRSRAAAICGLLGLPPVSADPVEGGILRVAPLDMRETAK